MKERQILLSNIKSVITSRPWRPWALSAPLRSAWSSSASRRPSCPWPPSAWPPGAWCRWRCDGGTRSGPGRALGAWELNEDKDSILSIQINWDREAIFCLSVLSVSTVRFFYYLLHSTRCDIAYTSTEGNRQIILTSSFNQFSKDPPSLIPPVHQIGSVAKFSQ